VSTTRLEIALWISTAVVVLGVRTAWKRAAAELPPLPAAVYPGPSPIKVWEPDSLTVRAERVITSNPFRVDRRPSQVPFQPQLQGGAMIPPLIRPPRPTLVLSGIMGGPPWHAVLEGLPGQQGSTVVTAGQTVGAFTIRRVSRDSAVVQGMDTTWRLGVRRSW
jgi:hypothetical protein